MLQVCALDVLVERSGEDAEFVGKHFYFLALIDLKDGTQVSQVVRVHCLEELIVLLASQSVVLSEQRTSTVDLVHNLRHDWKIYT